MFAWFVVENWNKSGGKKEILKAVIHSLFIVLTFVALPLWLI